MKNCPNSLKRFLCHLNEKQSKTDHDKFHDFGSRSICESMLNNIKISIHEIMVVFKQNTEDNFQAKLYTILP